MSFNTAYCTDATCRSIRIIQNDGNTIFSIPSRTDPTYLNLLLYAEVPFSYVPVSQFYCDPRLLTRGKILTTAEFLAQCDPVTGDLTVAIPATTEDWVAAHTIVGSDNVIAYTYDGQKFTLDPVDDALLFTEIDNYSDFLFGGKILTEYEADLYNIEGKYFTFPEPIELEDIIVEIDVDDLTPFTLVDETVSTQVDTGFHDFLQLSENLIDQYYNNFLPPPTVVAKLTRDTSLSQIWLKWYNLTTVPEFEIIREKLTKDLDS